MGWGRAAGRRRSLGWAAPAGLAGQAALPAFQASHGTFQTPPAPFA
jgi:hypothetical protein